MYDWSVEQLSAYEDIKADGFAITVRQPGSQSEFNPDTMAWEYTADPVDVETYAIRDEYKTSEVDGSIIQQGDCQLIVPAYGLQPGLDNTYQVLIDSEVHNIVNIGVLSPCNVPLLFYIQVRK